MCTIWKKTSTRSYVKLGYVSKIWGCRGVYASASANLTYSVLKDSDCNWWASSPHSAYASYGSEDARGNLSGLELGEPSLSLTRRVQSV